MMNLWKSLPNRCACERKCCNRTSARRRRWRRWKKGETRQQTQKIREHGPAANVHGPLQLRNDIRGREKLRSPGDGLEPVLDLSELRQAARSQEPAAASGISQRGVLEGRRVLARFCLRPDLTCPI